MTYEEAMSAIEEGKTVRRGALRFNRQDGLILKTTPDGVTHRRPIEFDDIDKQQTDWEVVTG